MKILIIIVSIAVLIIPLSSGFCRETMASATATASTDSFVFKNPFIPMLPEPPDIIEEPVIERPIDRAPAIETRAPREEPPKPPEPVAPPQLNIAGIVWNTDRPQAIINDEVVDVGMTVNGAKIAKITRAGVEIEFKAQIFSIGLSEAPGPRYDQYRDPYYEDHHPHYEP